MSDHRPSLHERMESAMGIEMRLFYGLFVPAAVIVVLVAALAFSPSWWVLAALGVALVGATGVVTVGILQMLGDDEDDDQ